MGLKEEMEDIIHLIAEPLNKEEYDIYSVETDCIRDVCELYNEDVTYGENTVYIFCMLSYYLHPSYQ